MATRYEISEVLILKCNTVEQSSSRQNARFLQLNVTYKGRQQPERERKDILHDAGLQEKSTAIPTKTKEFLFWQERFLSFPQKLAHSCGNGLKKHEDPSFHSSLPKSSSSLPIYKNLCCSQLYWLVFVTLIKLLL